MPHYRFLMTMALVVASPATAQQAIDRADPARVERDRERAPATQSPAKAPLRVEVEPLAKRSVDLGGTMQIGAIAIEGLRELPGGDFADIIASYIGRSVGNEDLATLAGKVAERARQRGLVFASAYIPPQRLTAGVLTVRVDEGVIDALRLNGIDAAPVRAVLNSLVGRPARLEEVERRLMIAGDLDGFDIRRSRFVREGDTGVLLVEVTRTKPRIRAVLDNDSSSPIGPEQLRLDVDLPGLLFADDAVTVTYLTTPVEPEELQYSRLRYTKRVSSTGTELGFTASAARTHPGSYLRPLDIRGMSWTLGANVLQPLARSRAESLWLSVGFELRDLDQTRRDVRFRHDRLAIARINLYGNAKVLGGRLRANATLSQGLDVFGATEAGDRLASRRDADGTFTTFFAFTDWVRPLADQFSLRLAAQSQIASGPLLVAEEIGLGGAAFVRGYDYSERSGDQGAMASAELRYDWKNPLGFGRKAQLYTFIDGGRVTELGRGRFGGSLASGGGGIRADVSPTIDANFEVALPLSGERFETGNKEPQLHFRLLKLF